MDGIKKISIEDCLHNYKYSDLIMFEYFNKYDNKIVFISLFEREWTTSFVKIEYSQKVLLFFY